MSAKLWLLLALLPFVAQAATLHVPADYPTIQAGVTAAGAGDTVLVADGTYTGIGNYDIELLGKTIVVRSESSSASCVLDAQHQGRLFSVVGSESAVLAGFTLTRGSGDGGAVYCSEAVLRLQDCLIEDCSGYLGAGLWARQSSIVVSACTFLDCAGGRKGGAIHIDSSALVLQASVFDSNSARLPTNDGAVGGAISIGRNCTVTIDSCSFYRNWVAVWGFSQVGGAIGCDTLSTLTITASQFLENGISTASGGAVYCYGATVDISDCAFLENGHYDDQPRQSTARLPGSEGALPAVPVPLYGHIGSGGALYLKHSTSAVSRSLFVGNGAPPDVTWRFGGAGFLEGGTVVFSGCTFVDNIGRLGRVLVIKEAQVTLDSCVIALQTRDRSVPLIEYWRIRTDTSGGQLAITCTDSWGNGGDWVGLMDTLADKYNNFSADPRFCRQSEGNYHLQEDSPCRPEASPCGSLVGALPVEPGCLSCCVMPGNVNAAGIVDGGDLALLVAYLTNSAGSKPTLPCPDEANVNAAGIVDGSDLALLVAYLTNAPEQKPMLPFCP